MSGKTHASDKPAQAQPAIPERLPARWPITGPSQKASQLRHAIDKLLDGQPLDGHALLRSDHLRLLWLDPLHSWLLGLFTTQVTQLKPRARQWERRWPADSPNFLAPPDGAARDGIPFSHLDGNPQ